MDLNFLSKARKKKKKFLGLLFTFLRFKNFIFFSFLFELAGFFLAPGQKKGFENFFPKGGAGGEVLETELVSLLKKKTQKKRGLF